MVKGNNKKKANMNNGVGKKEKKKVKNTLFIIKLNMLTCFTYECKFTQMFFNVLALSVLIG